MNKHNLCSVKMHKAQNILNKPSSMTVTRQLRRMRLMIEIDGKSGDLI